MKTKVVLNTKPNPGLLYADVANRAAVISIAISIPLEEGHDFLLDLFPKPQMVALLCGKGFYSNAAVHLSDLNIFAVEISSLVLSWGCKNFSLVVVAKTTTANESCLTHALSVLFSWMPWCCVFLMNLRLICPKQRVIICWPWWKVSRRLGSPTVMFRYGYRFNWQRWWDDVGWRDCVIVISYNFSLVGAKRGMFVCLLRIQGALLLCGWSWDWSLIDSRVEFPSKLSVCPGSGYFWQALFCLPEAQLQLRVFSSPCPCYLKVQKGSGTRGGS